MQYECHNYSLLTTYYILLTADEVRMQYECCNYSLLTTYYILLTTDEVRMQYECYNYSLLTTYYILLTADEVRMQYECYNRIEFVESQRGALFSHILYMRADSEWLQPMTLGSLLEPALLALRQAYGNQPHDDGRGSRGARSSRGIRSSRREVGWMGIEGGRWAEVLIPDTEDYWGYNDRFAVMNRQAAPRYFSRCNYSLLTTYYCSGAARYFST